MKPGDPLARQRLALETRHRRAELALARRQVALAEAQLEAERAKSTQGSRLSLLSPSGVVLVGAMFGLIGTAVGKWIDNRISQRELETSVILKASDVPATLTEDAQAVQRARNLLWFQRAGYINLHPNRVAQLEREARIPRGQALAAPVVQQPTAASAPSATGPRFNFLVLNNGAIDPRGWDIDIFSCTVGDAQAQGALEFARGIAANADRGVRLNGERLGRIRFDASPDHRRAGNQIFYDANEVALAQAIEQLAERQAPNFATIANNEGATAYYLSVYFCQPTGRGAPAPTG